MNEAREKPRFTPGLKPNSHGSRNGTAEEADEKVEKADKK